MAQKKGGGSTRNGRDSQAKRLGVKRYGGQLISAGSIIVRPDLAAGVTGEITHVDGGFSTVVPGME